MKSCARQSADMEGTTARRRSPPDMCTLEGRSARGAYASAAWKGWRGGALGGLGESIPQSEENVVLSSPLMGSCLPNFSLLGNPSIFARTTLISKISFQLICCVVVVFNRHNYSVLSNSICEITGLMCLLHFFLFLLTLCHN